MKIVTRKDKGFVYEHEMTRSKKLGNVVENVVNHLLVFTFSGIFLTALVVAVISIVQ